MRWSIFDANRNTYVVVKEYLCQIWSVCPSVLSVCRVFPTAGLRFMLNRISSKSAINPASNECNGSTGIAALKIPNRQPPKSTLNYATYTRYCDIWSRRSVWWSRTYCWILFMLIFLHLISGFPVLAPLMLHWQHSQDKSVEYPMHDPQCLSPPCISPSIIPHGTLTITVFVIFPNVIWTLCKPPLCCTLI